MKFLFRLFTLCLPTLLTSCLNSIPEEGISIELARDRSTRIDSLRYSLQFDIPEIRTIPVKGQETLTFILTGKRHVYLDAKGFEVHSISVNGRESRPEIINEHIALPRRLLRKGHNEIFISFTAGEQSLNRRDEFLYTLLVPDRARTLFPCFDQPDMKARYTLSLKVPQGWQAISNTPVDSVEEDIVHFRETEPLSTYLFSFVAGRFECVTAEGIDANDTPIHLYHRETDPDRIAQCPEILRQVKQSIDWLEEYTGIDYPFAKYDLIILPDFQYGGMEHTGATLYNDRRMFLSTNPTTDELLGRASLIAHETAHMWFGDYVTMKWFDDVWTKEVFANFFAAKMVRPLFPSINHHLSDLKNYYAGAYTEDRTIGSNAIQRPLGNLRDAGLIYCNIIYDKSPVVMSMLERRIGPEVFRDAIHSYLSSFAYGNATWDDLVGILAPRAPFDAAEWSRVWVKERGMPEFDYIAEGDKVTVRQRDPFGAGNVWQEDVSFTLIGETDSVEMTAVFDGCTEVVLEAPFEVAHVIPNSDGLAYGWFRLSAPQAQWLNSIYPEIMDENTRMSVLMTLYENSWHRMLPPSDFIRWACRMMPSERNALIRSSMMSYAVSADLWAGRSGLFEEFLHSTAANPDLDHEFRLTAFRNLVNISSLYDSRILEIWQNGKPYDGLTLSEKDYTSMAYQLMIRYPSMASSIREKQAERILNPDRREAFLYISKACSPDKAERDIFFESLLSASTRGPESRVTSALSLLVSPLHPEESVSRIRPALEVIEEIQRTGDIFFPSTWCSALLGSQTSPEAAAEVKSFVDTHPDLNPMLVTKILQKGGWLLKSLPDQL